MASGKKAGTQLVELFEKAIKAADKVEENDADEAEVARCVGALKAMRTVPVTTALLMDTQVGKRLRKVTKHKSLSISSMAQEIIDAWKKVVAAEAAAKNGITVSSDKSSKSPTASKDPLKSPPTGSREALKSPTTASRAEKVTSVKSTVKVEVKSTVSTIKNGNPPNGAPLKLPKCGDPSRDRIRELLGEAFSKVLTEAEEELLEEAKQKDIAEVAVTLENAMFKKLGTSKDANKLKYRSIMFNIKDGNNPDLRRRVLLGEIEPEELMTMSIEDMASDRRKAENQKIKDKALFECERGLKAAHSTDQFKCAKCKKRQCTYFQMQTRSADEPMTTFVTCVNCNNHWKFC